jgi:hypothetical protein
LDGRQMQLLDAEESSGFDGVSFGLGAAIDADRDGRDAVNDGMLTEQNDFAASVASAEYRSADRSAVH